MNRRLIAAALTLSLSAFAQEPAAAPAAPVNTDPPPPAAEIKRVHEYLENGKDRGPALLDIVPCTKVDQTNGSATQYQCVEPVTAPVKKGTTVFAWMQWYTPKDGKYEDVTLQFLHEAEVRQTVDLAIAGYGRTRSFRGVNASKVGKWTMKILRNGKELGAATFDVAP